MKAGAFALSLGLPPAVPAGICARHGLSAAGGRPGRARAKRRPEQQPRFHPHSDRRRQGAGPRARIEAGTSVTVTNSGKEMHTASAVDGSWTTGEIAPGQSVNLFFNKPGTYTYICRDHPWTQAQLMVE